MATLVSTSTLPETGFTMVYFLRKATQMEKGAGTLGTKRPEDEDATERLSGRRSKDEDEGSTPIIRAAALSKAARSVAAFPPTVTTPAPSLLSAEFALPSTESALLLTLMGVLVSVEFFLPAQTPWTGVTSNATDDDDDDGGADTAEGDEGVTDNFSICRKRAFPRMGVFSTTRLNRSSMSHSTLLSPLGGGVQPAIAPLPVGAFASAFSGRIGVDSGARAPAFTNRDERPVGVTFAERKEAEETEEEEELKEMGGGTAAAGAVGTAAVADPTPAAIAGVPFKVNEFWRKPGSHSKATGVSGINSSCAKYQHMTAPLDEGDDREGADAGDGGSNEEAEEERARGEVVTRGEGNGRCESDGEGNGDGTTDGRGPDDDDDDDDGDGVVAPRGAVMTDAVAGPAPPPFAVAPETPPALNREILVRTRT